MKTEQEIRQKEKAERLAKAALGQVEYLIRKPPGLYPPEAGEELVEGIKDALLKNLERAILTELEKINSEENLRRFGIRPRMYKEYTGECTGS